MIEILQPHIQALLLRHHNNGNQVETVPIAQELGLNVYRVKDWNNDLSGMIKRDTVNGGTSGYAIFVNANHIPTRRRFTIAHEIAHFILHKNDIGDGIVDDGLYRSALSNPKEVEANKLAADILMPWHLINRFIAERLNVSKSAMSIRLGVPYETY